jgi:hypothetical protein
MRRSEISKRIIEMAPTEIIYYLNYNKVECENESERDAENRIEKMAE